MSVFAGSNLLSFSIPAGAKPGTTFSRFRLSSAGGLATTGQADDGEVEDYLVSILDSQVSNTVTLDSMELGDHEVLLLDGQLIVRSQSKPIFSAPASNIGRMKLATPSGQTTYEIRSPAVYLFGTLRYTEVGRNVLIATSHPRVDLTGVPDGALLGLRVIDLSANVPQVLILTSSNIASLNDEKSIGILLGEQDSVQTASPWVLSNRQLEQNGLSHVFQKDGSTVRIKSPTSWQNPLNQYDADGDGRLSPLDVLVIINHLNRLAGSNSNTTLPVFEPANPLGQFFVDVNGSNSCEPLDVLEVINQINQVSFGGGEGEGDNRLLQRMESWNWHVIAVDIRPAFDDEDKEVGVNASD